MRKSGKTREGENRRSREDVELVRVAWPWGNYRRRRKGREWRDRGESDMESASKWAEVLVKGLQLGEARSNLEAGQENQRQQAGKHRRAVNDKIRDKG